MNTSWNSTSSDFWFWIASTFQLAFHGMFWPIVVPAHMGVGQLNVCNTRYYIYICCYNLQGLGSAISCNLEVFLAKK